MLNIFKTLFSQTEKKGVPVSFQNDLDSSESTFQVRPGTRLFDALNSEGIGLLSLCGGGGICGKCKVRVNSGALQSMNPEVEKKHLGLAYQRNVRLACQSKVNSAVCISEFNSEVQERIKFELISNVRITESIHELSLIAKPCDFTFKSGQHIGVVIPIEGSDEIVRSYSILNSFAEYADSKVLKLNIRLHRHRTVGEPGLETPTDVSITGKGSSYLCSLQAGSKIEILPPFGTMSFDAIPEQDHFILLAGGVGIVPMISLLDESLRNDDSRKFELFYGVREASDACHKDRLEKFAAEMQNFSYQVCPSKDKTSGARQLTHYLENKYSQQNNELQNAVFLVCGPPSMVSAVQIYLQERGVSKSRIQTDSFD